MGYDKRLDLRTLAEKVKGKVVLDEEEQAAWNRCGVILWHIGEGDLVVVKNLPSREKFSIVKVTGPYDFRIARFADYCDYGHCLPVRVMNTYHKYSKLVPSPFVNALNREQNPVRITYRHRLTAIELAGLSPEILDKDTPEDFKSKVTRLRHSLLPRIQESLKQNLKPSETERLVLELLRTDGMDVLWNAGAGEKGADILSAVQLGYGLTSRIAVQVKCIGALTTTQQE